MIRAIDYLKIMVCFLFGSAVTALPGMLFAPEFWLIVFFYGLIFGLPALILVVVLYSVFIKNILVRPNLWCFWTPFVLTGSIVSCIYLGLGNGGDIYVRAFLSEGYLTFTVIMIFIGTVAATFLFRSWVLFPKEYAARRALQKG